MCTHNQCQNHIYKFVNNNKQPWSAENVRLTSFNGFIMQSYLVSSCFRPSLYSSFRNSKNILFTSIYSPTASYSHRPLPTPLLPHFLTGHGYLLPYCLIFSQATGQLHILPYCLIFSQAAHPLLMGHLQTRRVG